jgi:hypothetical protein
MRTTKSTRPEQTRTPELKRGATFSGVGNFGGAKFSSYTNFRDATFAFGAEFQFARFSHDANFKSVRFGDDSGSGGFEGADFGTGRVSFADPKQWGPPPPVFDWDFDPSKGLSMWSRKSGSRDHASRPGDQCGIGWLMPILRDPDNMDDSSLRWIFAIDRPKSEDPRGRVSESRIPGSRHEAEAQASRRGESPPQCARRSGADLVIIHRRIAFRVVSSRRILAIRRLTP